jgi:O-acetyl-ADP-ribose deacetylase (regulator of RNase III)
MVSLMIEYRRGNLFESGAAALVNTVNEVGAMRKGFALMFRDTFPANTAAYLEAVRTGEVRVGRMFVTENRTPGGPAWIVNFPTKKHWRNPSKLEWIREGLRDLVRVVTERNIPSVALPPCGCGSGGLDWAVVRREIEGELSGLKDVHVMVFEPAEVEGEAPDPARRMALTPAQALVLEMVRRYAVLGLDCTSFEVQRLAWFLDRSIRALGLPDPLGLQFAARKYGPYAGRLTEVIDGLAGSYLRCEKRRGQAGPLDRIWFEDDCRDAVMAALERDEARPYQPALTRAARVIDGFESPLGLELLATVDWLLAQDRVTPTRSAVKAALRSWPGGRLAVARKLRLFDDRRLDLALRRLVGRGPAGDRPVATGR